MAVRLNLSKPSVSRNVADLISMGIVEERGEGESTKNGGRKPTRLCFNKEYCYIASLELSAKQPICAIGDLKCNILSLIKIDIDRNAPSELKKESISKAFEEMLAEMSIPLEKLGLIVISQPGQIGRDNEVIYIDALHHPWTNIGLKEHLQEHFQTPVMLKNDVQMAAIGEIKMGDAKRLQSLIYVSCGIGLGSSVIYKGQIFEGGNYGAGELGAFLMPDGRRLGEIVSMDGLLKYINELCIKNDSNADRILSFEEIVEKSLVDDALVNQGLKDIGRILGQAIYNCCIMMDISAVIFGGDYIRLGPALIESIKETMKQPFLPMDLTIQKSGLGETAGILGSFVTAKDAILQSKIGL